MQRPPIARSASVQPGEADTAGAIRLTALVAAALVVLSALTSVLGTLLSIPALTNTFAGPPPMPIISRTAILCAGVCLFALTIKRSPAGSSIALVRLLAMAVILLGVGDVAGAGIQSRVVLLLSGIGIVCLCAEEPAVRSLAQYIAVIVFWAASTAISGYLYGFDFLFKLGFFPGIPLRGGLTLFCLGVAMFLSRPGTGPASLFLAQGAGGSIARRFLLPLFMAGPLLGLLTGVGVHHQLGLAVLATLNTFIVPLLVWALAANLSRQEAEKIVLGEQLRVSEQQFRKLITDIRDCAICRHDPKGIVISWSEGAQNIFGYEASEIVGRTCSALYPDDPLGVHDEVLAKALTEGYGQAEALATRKDGTQFWVNLDMYGLRGRCGAVATVAAFMVDITEKKALEQNLQDERRRLEARTGELQKRTDELQERTYELTAANTMLAHINEKLIEARDQAQIASRYKSEFVANMSHEIRTPLNAVLGMAELLSRTELDERQHGYVINLRESGEALLAVIEEILDFSKIEAGKVALEMVPFSPVKLVEGVAENLIVSAWRKRLSLLSFVDPEIPPSLLGDPVRLSRILLNLGSNAVKFTEQGEVVIRVELETHDGSTVRLLFTVTDTGIGMTQEQIAVIFEPFAQADRSMTRKYGGTGLGLSICSRLVEAMHGQISVRSAPGEGSTFSFTVSLEKCAEPAQKQLAPTALRNLRVLVADDEPNARAILHSYLISWGMRTGQAANAGEALQLLKEAAKNADPYDVAIVDYLMPGMNGLELAGEIARDPALKEVRLMLVTACDEPGLSDEAISCGFTAYLSKPIRQSQLMDALVAAVDRAPGAQIRKRASTFRYRRRITFEQARPTRQELILVVEDHPINQEVAVTLLQHLGFEVHVAENGPAALRAVERSHYSLVFMDIQMPEIDGFAVTRMIRASEALEGGRLPIIAMTAHALEGSREDCIAAGMDDYISKPLDSEELLNMLNKWIPGVAGETVPAERSSKDSASEAAAAIDLETMTTSYGQEVTGRILRMLIADVPAHITALRQRLQEHDSAALTAKAHELKGVFGTVHSAGMRQISVAINTAAGERDWSTVKSAIDKLESEFEHVKEIIESRI